MKNNKHLLLLGICITIISFSHAQPIADLYLKGKWKAECPIEVQEKASFRHCQLCPFVKVSEKNNRRSLKAIEMSFGPDSLTLNQNGTVTTVAYSRDNDTHAISFMLNDKQNHFRVFKYDEQRILEDANGLLLVLTPIKE